MLSRSLHIALAVLLCFAVVPSWSTQVEGVGEPKTVYISTADYQKSLGQPMDSPETVKANIEALKECINADTLWWRGFQDDLVLQTHVIRPEYRTLYDWWMWLKHLNYDIGCNDIAARTAHDLGMKVWVFTALFDWGSQADAARQPEFPYTIEYKLRVDHPEYAPVNKYGTRRLGGPVEFCYPEVRKAVIKDLMAMMTRNNLDGLMFYDYAENSTMRYFDEFGFNKPIVDEYMCRYGVNILTQPFDKEKLAKLRGEYVTLFLGELHSEMKKRDMKLGCQLAPTDSHLPAGGRALTVGRIYLDWETWVKEGVIDEISVALPYGPESETLLQELFAACKGTAVKVSQFKSKGDMTSPDVHRVAYLGGEEIMSGFGWEANIGWDGEKIWNGDSTSVTMKENLSEQPLSNLRSDDKYARRRVLYMVCREKQKAPLADVIAATKDPDVFARVLAVRALGVMKDPAAVPAIEEALLDTENSVRIEAVLCLTKHPSTTSIARMLDAIWRDNSTWQFNYVAVEGSMPQLMAAGKVTPTDVDTLLARTEDLNRKNRRVAFSCLIAAGLGTDPRVRAIALKALESDPDEYVQEHALKMLVQNEIAPDITDALSKAVKETKDATQVRATVGLLNMARRVDSSSAFRRKVVADASAFFSQYGDKCSRSDVDWGWCEVGYSLRDLGDDGRKALADLMAQRKDRKLADNAWHILYIIQDRQMFVPTTAAEDAKAHAVRPKW